LIIKLANNIDEILLTFVKQLNHPWKKRISAMLSKKAIIFWVVRDVLENNKEQIDEILNDEELLVSETKKAIQKRYKDVRTKLGRGVVRSIIYVFFTKTLLAFAIEFPMDLSLVGSINYYTAGTNVLFPPILMTIVALLIRMPKKENETKIIEEVKDLCLNNVTKKTLLIKQPRKRGIVANGIFHLIYTLTFLFSIFIIFSFLNRLGFNVFSSVLFVFFLTLVSFFGIRIRRSVKELMVIDKRDNLLTLLVDFFALPFVSMGRWLSGKFSKINFIAIFLDVIIEAPFKLIIEVFEDLFGFFREKKEDVLSE